MTHPFSDEFISAWLDDELNDSEAAEIQAAVESDARLARRVNELRVLSGILKSLPVEPVPSGFKDLVLEATQGIVRDTSAAAGSPAVGKAVVKSNHPHAHRWWFGIVGLVSTAALVLVTINLTGEPGGDRIASPTSIVANSDTTDEYRQENEAPAKSFDDDAAAGNVPSATESFEEVPAAAILVDDSSSSGSLPPAYDVSQLNFDRSLNGVDVGDVIQAIRQSGDDMTVVKLTVVNVKASVDRLEVLLTSHEGTAKIRAGGMVMMVEGNHQQLAECFRTLQQEDLYEQMMMASKNVDSHDLNSVNIASRPPSNSKAMRRSKSPAGLAPGKAKLQAGDRQPGPEPAEAVEEIPVVAAKGIAAGQSTAPTEESDSFGDTASRTVLRERQKKPIRLLIVLEPSAASETKEGNGSIIEFQDIYGPIG